VTLREVIARHGDVLDRGKHDPSDGGPCCILEAVSECRGLEWTDDPEAVGWPDVRHLNDAYRDPERRTVAMLRLADAGLGDWGAWPEERRAAYVQRVVLRIIRDLLPATLRGAGLEDAAAKCEAAGDLLAASYAAINAASYAARAASDAASYAASDDVLDKYVTVFAEEAAR
jgi:hypothetical protein